MSRLQHIVSLASMILVMACAQNQGGPSASSDDAANKGESVVSSPELVNTYWKLTALDDQAVTVANNQREPHFVLRPDTKQVSGSGGCNGMFGSYTLDGSNLSFGAIGATKMACQYGMDTESAFFQALQRVARWKITGQQLELTDTAGAVIARFEARVMK